MQTVSLRTRRLRVVATMCAVLASALVTGCGQDSGDDTAAATSEAAKVVPKQTTTPSQSVSGSPSGTAQLTKDQTERKELLSKVKVTFDKAATTAVGEVSGGKLTELDLEGLDDDTDASASPSGTASPGASPSGSPSPGGSATVRPSGTAGTSASPSGSPSPSGSSAAPKWVAEVVEEDGTAHIVHIDAVSGKVIDSAADTNQSDSDKAQLAEWIKKAQQSPTQAAKVATDKKKGTVTSVNLDENSDSTLVWSVGVVSGDWKKTDFEVDAVSGAIVSEQTDSD